MSLELITEITQAEKEAKRIVAEAEAKAKQMISDAENAGRASVQAANEKAGVELAELKKRADNKALSDAEVLSGDTETKKAALRAKAGTKLQSAAEMVVERIVNG